MDKLYGNEVTKINKLSENTFKTIIDRESKLD